MATTDALLPAPPADQAAVLERSADARLARVHLRGGLLALARASLERMAGDGTLDREAMADLAEARWRSGDLEGAADAAQAHQASGGTEPLAALILAEDLAVRGYEREAIGLAQSVADQVGGAFDQLFAREPRSRLWPEADDGWMAEGADAPGRWGLLVGGSEVAHPRPGTWPLSPIQQPEPTRTDDAHLIAATASVGLGQPSRSGSTTAALISGQRAGEELALADQAIAAGDALAASHRLAVLLRLEPALAPVILSAADRAASAARPGSAEVSALHLIRGDAYRILGRDNEAAAAYRLAHQALRRGPASKEPM